MPDDMTGHTSEAAGSFRRSDTPLVRVAESVAANLITASVLWIVARAAGYVSGRPVLTAAAVGVLTAAVVVFMIRLVLRNRLLLWRVRAVANWINLSTPVGLLLAWVGGAREFSLDPKYRIRQARYYRARWPASAVLTVGNVLIIRQSRPLNVQTLVHEGRHSTQYAWCLGLPAIVLYAMASGWSMLIHGDPIRRNIFETRAGLPREGYTEPPPRHRSLGFWVIVGAAAAAALGSAMALLAWAFL